MLGHKRKKKPGRRNKHLWHKPLLALGVAMVLLTSLKPTLAAEKVTFTYGLASVSVSLEELEAFATTGEVSPSIDFLLDFSGQNPDVVRWLLRGEFPTNTAIASYLLNTIVGEYALSQSSNIVHSSSPRGDIQALRGALIASSQDDGRVSLLELWRNYPTKQVYVDGESLISINKKANETLENLADYTELSAQLWQQFWK
ncbi:MAG: alpha/beta hydrolase [Xenococcaceae cyanobacterium MO_167.B27]|nr:alpha/beta hydrolase [Xenococcaceae cyanobacterium MO_167.B27]